MTPRLWRQPVPQKIKQFGPLFCALAAGAARCDKALGRRLVRAVVTVQTAASGRGDGLTAGFTGGGRRQEGSMGRVHQTGCGRSWIANGCGNTFADFFMPQAEKARAWRRKRRPSLAIRLKPLDQQAPCIGAEAGYTTLR